MANQNCRDEEMMRVETLHQPLQVRPVGRSLLASGSTISGEGGIQAQVLPICDETGCYISRPGVPPPYF